MQPRPGFARLLPLLVLTGLAAGSITLLASPTPRRAPAYTCILHASASLTPAVARKFEAACSGDFYPVPAHRIHDATGRLWELEEIPGQEVRGLELSGAEWGGVSLHGATFTACNFRDCDLEGADLSGVTLWECDF